MITKDLAKQLIEQAEYNCSGEKVNYEINEIIPLSEEGAYLIKASSKVCYTSFVAYDDGSAYFLNDWQGSCPNKEDEICEYTNWVTIDWLSTPVMFLGLPRVL